MHTSLRPPRWFALTLGGTATVVLASSLLGGAPTQAATLVEIDRGHLDVFRAVSDGAASPSLELAVGDEEAEEIRDPDDVLFRVGDNTLTTLPSPNPLPFLGQPGDTVFVLPEVQQNDRLWPGWGAEEPEGPGEPGLPPGVFDGDLTLAITGIDGPGDLKLWFDGATTAFVDTADGLPDTFPIQQGSDAHANWAFTEPGSYTITAELSGDLPAGAGTVTSTPTAYRFEVQSPVVALAEPGLEGLMAALAGEVDGLQVATTTTSTYTGFGCPDPAAPRPLPGEDYLALLTGMPYVAVGTATPTTPDPACVPDAVTTFSGS